MPHKLTCCVSNSAFRNALHTSGRQMPVLHMIMTILFSSAGRFHNNTQQRVITVSAVSSR